MSENEITITVHGHIGVGKSAVSLAILDALRAAGLACTWDDEQSERNLGTGAGDIAAMEERPTIRLIETNPSRWPEWPIGRLQLRQGQIQQLADFAGVPVEGTAEEDQDVLQLTLGHVGHSGPGLYASFDDVPEGGAIFLGVPEGDPQLLFSADIAHPKNGEQRRWFLAGASAVATGRAFVNSGDSERQFITDSDDDTAALQVATQFTLENEPRKRAELQVAIIAALQHARASQERGLYHVADTLPIAVNARRLGHCLEVIRLNLGSIESSARHLVPGNNDDRLRLANMQHEVTHAQQVLKSVEEIVCELLTGTKVPPAFDYFAPEYYIHDGAGLVHFSRVPPAEWPEWATEALQRMGGGVSLYDDLLAVLQAKDHTTARANIGGMRGRIVSLQSQLEDSGRRLVDAQRLAWALVDAAGGSVELGQSVLATTDWRGKKLQQLQVPTGGVRFTSTQDTPR
ncbi:hypothetical protein HXXDennis_56 [Xanthomonas phage HXX_Dennis]|nr:hypothetical protein HXXDennis_56 [Xanthomonas phage HXX_Dennis]